MRLTLSFLLLLCHFTLKLFVIVVVLLLHYLSLNYHFSFNTPPQVQCLRLCDFNWTSFLQEFWLENIFQSQLSWQPCKRCHTQSLSKYISYLRIGCYMKVFIFPPKFCPWPNDNSPLCVLSTHGNRISYNLQGSLVIKQ